MILVVADDPSEKGAIGALLAALGYAWHAIDQRTCAIETIRETGKAGVSAVLFPLPSTDQDKAERALAKTIRSAPALPVIAVTEEANIADAVRAMRLGASDVLAQPLTVSKLGKALEALPLTAGEKIPPKMPSAGQSAAFDMLIAEAPATRQAIALAKRAAAASIPILIQGESGAGKEIFAHAIHQASPRSQGPFVAVNCGAIPSELVESILFGHEKGAFTGAHTRSTGKFQEASGGVLFLDEVGELPASAQVKLLRALQDGLIEPVGASRTIKADFRVISATNRDLAEDVASGHFREDLYYRLSAFPLTLPALRDRQEDILPLASLFTKRFAAQEGRSIDGMDTAAAALLLHAHWPGNVRQLENAIHRAVILADGRILEVEDFPGLDIAANKREPDCGSPGKNGPFWRADGHIRPLAEIEREAVSAALHHYDGAVSEAARRLGIGRSTLYRKSSGQKIKHQ